MDQNLEKMLAEVRELCAARGIDQLETEGLLCTAILAFHQKQAYQILSMLFMVTAWLEEQETILVTLSEERKQTLKSINESTDEFLKHINGELGTVITKEL